MGLQSDALVSQGDLMHRLRELDQKVEALQTARRLESASIGAGGLRVKGGSIIILDAAGNEQMRLSTDGLTLQGLLEVLGRFEFRDEAGNLRLRIAAHADGQQPNLEYRAPGTVAPNQEVLLGAIFEPGTDTVLGHGLLAQTAAGPDILQAWSGGTTGWRAALRTPHGRGVEADEDGLAFPRLPVNWVVGQNGDLVSDGDGLRGVAEGHPIATYPAMRMVYRVNNQGGFPEVRVRVRDVSTDTVLDGFRTFSTASPTYQTVDLDLSAWGHLVRRLVRAEAEVTSGTGTARVSVVGAWVGDFS